MYFFGCLYFNRSLNSGLLNQSINQSSYFSPLQYKRVRWEGWVPHLEFDEDDDSEKETNSFDAEAMKYLRLVLVPILFGESVISF